jgi:hypothetical protein
MVAADAVPEFFDNPDRFVSDDQPRFDRIFTAQNMEIRSADGGERDPDDSFAYASTRAWDCFDLNVMRAVEDGRAHRVRFHIFQHFMWHTTINIPLDSLRRGDRQPSYAIDLVPRQGQQADAYRSVSNPDQLFLVVRAMKLVISCSNFLLPHAGQVAWPLSCSFSVIAMRDSFPHARHL